MSNKKIVVSAGGTGGHIIPALSVSLQLLKHGGEVSYIGNADSLEAEIISKHGIPFYAIKVQKIYRALTLRHFLFPFILIKSIFQCVKYLKQIKPDAFIGFGGYVSGPPAIAAWLLRIPVHLQEQNCRPGLTNIWTGKFASKVFIAHEESQKYFKGKKAILTGNPILDNANTGDVVPHKNIDWQCLYGGRLLLILGGSQGSLFINNLVLDNLDALLAKGFKIVWQTGKKHLETIAEKVKNYPNVLTFDFTDQLHLLYQNADYVISRGGALCLAEIDVYRLPAFIIPLSTAAVNEQYHNAIAMQNANKALVMTEKEKDIFIDKFDDFLNKAKDMYTDDKPALHKTAAEKIAFILLEKGKEI